MRKRLGIGAGQASTAARRGWRGAQSVIVAGV